MADLEAEVKNWITDHRGSGIYSTKIPIFEARRWVDARSIMGFVGAAWSQIYDEAWNVKHRTIVKSQEIWDH